MPALTKYSLDRIIDHSLSESSPTEPLTLPVVKEDLRITITDDDNTLTRLITRCRKAIEEFCSISLVVKTVVVVADLSKEFELPYGPVTAFTTAEYRGSLTDSYTNKTLNTDYYLENISSFTRFYPAMSGRWKLTYTTGYASVPADLLEDLNRIIGYCLEHKGDEPLSSLLAGAQRPKSLDEALELFASKYQRKNWI